MMEWPRELLKDHNLMEPYNMKFCGLSRCIFWRAGIDGP